MPRPFIPKPRKSQGIDYENQPITRTHRKSKKVAGMTISKTEITTKVDPLKGIHETDESEEQRANKTCPNKFKIHERGRPVVEGHNAEEYPENSGKLHCYDCLDHSDYNDWWNNSWEGGKVISWLRKKLILEDFYDENQES